MGAISRPLLPFGWASPGPPPPADGAQGPGCLPVSRNPFPAPASKTRIFFILIDGHVCYQECDSEAACGLVTALEAECARLGRRVSLFRDRGCLTRGLVRGRCDVDATHAFYLIAQASRPFRQCLSQILSSFRFDVGFLSAPPAPLLFICIKAMPAPNSFWSPPTLELFPARLTMQGWEFGLQHGLRVSSVALLVVSQGSLEEMLRLARAKKNDPVLFEVGLAFLLGGRGREKRREERCGGGRSVYAPHRNERSICCIGEFSMSPLPPHKARIGLYFRGASQAAAFEPH